jgi:hypothetical protein
VESGSADGRALWQGRERPARVEEAAAWALEWHVARLEQRGAAGARHMADEAAAGRRAEGKSEQSRAKGLKVDERTDSQFSKNTGTPL